MVLSKDTIEYLTGRGWVLTSKGWVSPYDEAEYVRWDLLSALEIEEAQELGRQRKVVRDEWKAI